MSYYGSAKYAEAIPYLESVVGTSPDNLQLRMTLAQSCLWAELYNCTLEQYQEILRLNPQSAQADMLAGEARMDLPNCRGDQTVFRKQRRFRHMSLKFISD